MITQEARRAELKAAVDALKIAKQERRVRRDRWSQFQAQRARENSVVVTSAATGAVEASVAPLASYQTWDAWEPSSDEEGGPAFERNQPALLELERDIEERNKAAAEKKTRADALKAQGNEAFGRGEIAFAIRLYSDAIELKRDQKAYYCNRALAYLRQRFVFLPGIFVSAACPFATEPPAGLPHPAQTDPRLGGGAQGLQYGARYVGDFRQLRSQGRRGSRHCVQGVAAPNGGASRSAAF